MVPKSLTRYAEGLSVEAGEESHLRLVTAAPFGIAALLLVFPLFRLRPKREGQMIHRPDLRDSDSALFLVQSKSMYATFY